MMTNDIVNKIARLISVRDLSPTKEPKEVRVPKGLSERHDEVDLSETAQSYANPGAPVSEYEKEQFMKVERLKALVSGGNYRIDDKVADTIAERIANTLI